tara:strand:- start:1075 stop:1239 length:165 start_codon:yes stop_codon:yes gene_type:complete
MLKTFLVNSFGAGFMCGYLLSDSEHIVPALFLLIITSIMTFAKWKDIMRVAPWL